MKSEHRSIRVSLSPFRRAPLDVVAFADAFSPAQLAATFTQVVKLHAKDVMRCNAAQTRAPDKAETSTAATATSAQGVAGGAYMPAEIDPKSGSAAPQDQEQTFTRCLEDLLTFTNPQYGGLS